MPIQYSYDPNTNIVFTTASEEICKAQLSEYFKKILTDKKISNSFWEIINTENTNNITINYTDCLELSSLVERVVKEKDYQGALLFAPKRTPSCVAKLFFSVLRNRLPQTFCVETDPVKFQVLVYKYLNINYEFMEHKT